MNNRQKQLQAFDRLLTILETLREKCPWDRKQTTESLRQNTIEEVFELSTAIIQKDVPEIKKELGDVLLHILFYAKIASEKEQFDIADVCNQLCDKLIFRHPHVYPPTQNNNDNLPKPDNAEEVSHLWEQVKLKEKNGNKTVLAGIPDSLPTLIKAFRIQDKVANVGFDWEKREDVWEKVKEEMAELECEIKNPNSTNDQKEEELGDVLFSIINMARLYKMKPDNALEKTNQKFIRRFQYIEQKAKENKLALQDIGLAQMEEWWQEAKKI